MSDERPEFMKLLDLIRGPMLNGGLTTYPNGDDGQRRLYWNCVELERRGYLVRQMWEDRPDIVGFKVV